MLQPLELVSRLVEWILVAHVPVEPTAVRVHLRDGGTQGGSVFWCVQRNLRRGHISQVASWKKLADHDAVEQLVRPHCWKIRRRSHGLRSRLGRTSRPTDEHHLGDEVA